MDPFHSLLTQPTEQRVDAETLELLGRRASLMFQQQGIPLNQAIVQLLSEHPELGNEHIKRVVEFANNVTFQERFQNGQDKNVHFEVADPGVILRDLKDGGSPAHDGKTLRGGMGDYLTPPGQGDKGFQDNQDPVDLMFGSQNGAEGGVKLASAPVHPGLHSNPIDDVYDAHVRLQAARQELVGAHEEQDLLLKQAHDELYHVIRREVISPDGAGLGGVVAALEKVALDRRVVLDVLTPLIEKLAAEGLSKASLSHSLEKRAGATVNPQHPLVRVWAGISKLAMDKVKTEMALQDIDDGLEQTSSAIKRAGAITSGVKQAVGVRGRVPNAIRQRFPRA